MEASSSEEQKKQFQFITTVNTAERDNQSRRIVRSHARRVQNHKNAHSLTSVGSHSGSCQAPSSSKFKLISWTRKAAKRRSTLAAPDDTSNKNTQTLQGIDDRPTEILQELPLIDTLSVALSPAMRDLLRYWELDQSGYIMRSYPLDPEATWFDFMKTDPAPLHAFLSSITARHNLVRELDNSTWVDYHRGQSIRIINQRLDKEGRSTGISDGVIAAVAIMTNMESTNGCFEAANTHMNGLKRMVEIRGGLTAGFDHSTLLQRVLTWADFAFSTAWATPLSFPLVTRFSCFSGLKDQFLTRSLLGGTKGDLFTIKEKEILELFEILYSITNSLNFPDPSKLERWRISNSIYLLEWKFCSVESSPIARAQTGFLPDVKVTDSAQRAQKPPNSTGLTGPAILGEVNELDLSAALKYSAHIFLHLGIRDLHPAAKRHKSLTERLLIAVSPFLITFDPQSHSDLLPEPFLASDKDLGDVSRCSSSAIPLSGHDANYSPNNTPEVNNPHTILLVWILFVGSCVRTGPMESSPLLNPHLPGPTQAALMNYASYHDFFVSGLMKVCNAIGVTNKELLEMNLKEVIWLDGWCDDQVERLWTEVMEHLDTSEPISQGLREMFELSTF